MLYEYESKQLISIIIPVYNEESNIEPVYREILKALDSENKEYEFEFIFTDNHSEDRSFAILCELASKDTRIRGVRFTRNFGYQRSIYAGYSLSKGNAVVQIDCDLQDPPHLIHKFLRAWEQGFKIVYGVRRTRDESAFVHTLRRIFYFIIDVLSDDELPRHAGDFRLADRVAVDQLLKIKDPSIYIRGRFASMGYSSLGIDYDRLARVRGTSKFPWRSMFALALDGITSHSVAPLRIATYIGFMATIIALIVGGAYMGLKLALGSDWPAGWTTLSVLILFGIGLNGLFLGIIGEYLARIYLHLKSSPEVIIEQTTDNEH